MFCPFLFGKTGSFRCEVAQESGCSEPSGFPMVRCTGGEYYDCPLFINLCVEETEVFRDIEAKIDRELTAGFAPGATMV